MPKTACCQPRTLARHPLAHIEGCAHCGCVSVHLGAFTVRVDAKGLEALSAALTEALGALKRADDEGPERDTSHTLASPFGATSSARTRGQA